MLIRILTNYHDLDGQDVLRAIERVGAVAAADQLRDVLEKLGGHLPAASQDERWDQLLALWTDELDEADFLTAEADESLLKALEAHVSDHVDHYLKTPAPTACN